MDVGIAELVKHVTKFIERAEHGEEIVIKRHGKTVARLIQPEPKKKRQLGTLKGLITLKPGWDEPIPIGEWDAVSEITGAGQRKPKGKKAKGA
jgi:antitoxin (DNA-binding transcriptional repressor) of toxin-antitoxin stability system